MNKSPIRRVLLADDHKIFLEGLHSLLEGQKGIEVIGEAEEGYEAVRFARVLSPDIVVMDVSMPGLNGIEATCQIIKENPDIKVIALSMYSETCLVEGMLKAGACGYVLKQCAAKELVEAINKVLDGEVYLSSKITGVVVEDLVGRLSGDDSTEGILTLREREVLQLIAEEKCTKEIAAILNISVKTVETHRQHIMHKLKIDNVVGLTKYALSEGMTSLDF